ncbi:hypothetical protein TNCV_4836731 [Trichonephila clavipes]|nr:hypothetical protein TNCV_4836731 [Trichonephila clavipes]
MEKHEGSEPRNSEPWTSDEDDIWACTPPFKLRHHANGKTLSSIDLMCLSQPLHGGSLVAPGLEPTTRWPRVRDFNY